MNSKEVSITRQKTKNSQPLSVRMDSKCYIDDVEYFVLTTAMIATASLFTTLSTVLILATGYHTKVEYEKSIMKSIDPSIIDKPKQERMAFITYIKQLVSFKGIYNLN